VVGHDRERASLADLALEALTEPVVVCDADGTLVYVNAAAARLLGEPASALVGRLAETLLAPRSRMVDGQPFFRWLSGYPWQRGEGVRATLRRPDGVEIEQSFRVSTARRATGQPLTVVVLRRAGGGSADPLQQASEAPLPESTYRAVFDAVPVGVLHFDARARITACNDLFVQQMGSARHVLIGLDMLTLPNEEVRRAVREALAGRDGHFEGEYVSATGGARRLMRALFSPIMRDGRVAGGVGIVEDISERTEIEARLAQGERMASLGRLAAGVAHEINNPLAYVRTSLDIARREIERFRSDGDASRLERVLELIAHADDGVERVRVIANDLKTFSRGDEASWTAVDFGRVVETAINLAWNEIRHRAELVRRIDRVPPVMGSESRYVQVVVNLLVNAAQAIPEGHAHENRITVRVGRVDDSRVFLEVEDTGSGIDADRVKHVFEPFWTSKPKGVGTGLGLSICHGIVTAAGGEIRVARSQPGVGTTFRIELPAAPELDGEATAEMDAWVLEPPREERRARILVVDDEPKLGTTLRLALGDRYQVDVVDNGRDAQRILEEDGEFDLVLCDLMMPDVSGMDLYERVAAHRPDLAARFAFMTGGAFTERGRAFLRDHRVPRLEKPFSLDRVEELLRERMEQAPRS
jgi:PAS domain S-box-containing protein